MDIVDNIEGEAKGGKEKQGGEETYGQEKVRNIVSGVDGQANIGEVEAVAAGDEGQRDDMVAHKLLKVLARLLHAQHQHDSLLQPVRGLEEVVELDNTLLAVMRVPFEHAAGVEVPDGGAAHNVHPGGA